MQCGQEFCIGANVGAAIGIEWEFIATVNELLSQLKRPRFADDESIILQHDGLDFGHFACDKVKFVRHIRCRTVTHRMSAERLWINTKRAMVRTSTARIKDHQRPQRVTIKVVWRVQKTLVDLRNERQLVEIKKAHQELSTVVGEQETEMVNITRKPLLNDCQNKEEEPL